MDHSPRDILLALDLEGTLISNAISQIPRPHLHTFLQRCQERFGALVIYTAVRSQRARDVMELLADEGSAPDWFARLPIVDWEGEHKDLRHIEGWPPQRCMLLDDNPDYVLASQREQWLPIAPFDAPYPAEDRALLELLAGENWA